MCNSPWDIILVGLQNSSYVVLTLKCVYILIMSISRKYFRSPILSLCDRQNMKHCVYIGGKKYIILNTLFVKSYCFSVIQFYNCDISIGVLVGLNNVVWLYSLVHGYECFGGAFWVFLHRLSKDRGSMSWLKPRYPPIKLHDLIIQKTIILNLNVLHLLLLYLL